MKRLSVLFVLLTVSVVTLVTLGFSLQPQIGKNSLTDKETPIVSGVLPQSNQTNEITPIPFHGITSQALQKYAKTPIQTISIQGIEMSVTNFRKEGNEIYVEVCYQLPDNSDWTINHAIVTTKDSQTFLLSGGYGLEFTQTLDGSQRKITIFTDKKIVVEDYIASMEIPDYRCDRLDFVITSQNVDLSSVILTIESLIAIPREGQECQMFNDKVQSALDAKNSGIKFECKQEKGGSQIIIISKPESMSFDDAKNEISTNAISITYKGPWIFNGYIK